MRRWGVAMHARRILLVCYLCAILFLLAAGGGASSVLAQGLAEDYQAYQTAVKAGAPPDEIRRLAEKVYKAAPADKPALKGPAAYNLAKAEDALAEYDAALAHYEESIRLIRKAFGKKDIRLLDPYWDLGRLLARLAKNKEALHKLRAAATLAEIHKDTLAPAIPLFLDLDRVEAAAALPGMRGIRSFLKRIEDRLDTVGAEAPFFAGMVAFWRGEILLARKHRLAAAEEFSQAVELLRKRFDDSSEYVLTARAFHLQALEEAGHSDEATAECVAIARARSDEENAKFIPLYRVQPIYPRAAAGAGQQGYSVVSLTVTPDGRTADWKIVDSSPRGTFDRAALKAVKKFRYAPRIVDGEPVATKDVLYTFTFELKN